MLFNLFFSFAATFLTNQSVSLWIVIPLALLFAYAFIGIKHWRVPIELFKRDGNHVNLLEKKSISDTFFVVFLLTFVYLAISPALVSNAIKYFSPTTKIEVKQTSTELQQDVSKNDSTLIEEENNESYVKKQTTNNNNTEKKVEPTIDKTDDLSTYHPVARMLVRSQNTKKFPIVFFVFFLSVVILAPLTEELIFRVLLQGAFQKSSQLSDPSWNKNSSEEDVSFQHKKVGLKKLFSIIFIPALVFASLHIGVPEDPASPTPVEELFNKTLVGLFSNILTCVICVLVLWKYGRSLLVDLSLPTRTPGLRIFCSKVCKDFLFGSVLFFYFMPIIFCIKILAQSYFPQSIIDPIPIFIFALGEGFVFYKTGSYPVVVGMHASLNTTSFLLLCMSLS